MKKLFLILIFAFLFIGCEEENIKPEPYFFVGEWTTHMSISQDRKLVFYINFRIADDFKLDTSYFCYALEGCRNWSSAIFLKTFKFFPEDSTFFFELEDILCNHFKHIGKYQEDKDIFLGTSYYKTNEEYALNMDYEFVRVKFENDITTRGMIHY